MSQSKPWAVLLCKFKDDQRSWVSINKANTTAMLTDLTKESATAFWRDVSYGALDLSGSQVFGWLTLDHNQADYVGTGANPSGRQDLVSWARKAATDNNINLANFYGVAVFMSTGTDLWGTTGEVVCDLDSIVAQIFQEFGHGFGLIDHSRAVASPTTDYTDPFCIMSSMAFGQPTIQNPVLNNPTFSGDFGLSGPLLCSPYVDQLGWLTPDRQSSVPGDGNRPKPSTTIVLSPLGAQTAPNRQVAILDLHSPYQADYYFEYRSDGWDRGLAQKQVVIHQRRPDGYAYYAGNIPVSVGVANGTTLLPSDSWADPSFDLSVRIIRVPNPDDDSVEIVIGPRAAVLPLSVRTIARDKLNLTAALSVRNQIMRPNTASSLRRSLLALLDT